MTASRKGNCHILCADYGRRDSDFLSDPAPPVVSSASVPTRSSPLPSLPQTGPLPPSRLPSWLLPPGPLPPAAVTRPDLLFMDGVSSRVARQYRLLDRRARLPRPALRRLQAVATLYVVECKCASDTTLTDAVAAASAQHASLLDTLRSAGWRIHPVVLPVVVGYTGFVHRSVTSLSHLGLDSARVARLSRRLHTYMVRSTSTVWARRLALIAARPASAGAAPSLIARSAGRAPSVRRAPVVFDPGG